MSRGFFDNIEKKTNVKKEDIFKLANSVSTTDLNDETQLRKLISDLSQLANVPVTKEKEDKIVNTILSKKMPTDLDQLTKMIKKR